MTAEDFHEATRGRYLNLNPRARVLSSYYPEGYDVGIAGHNAAAIHRHNEITAMYNLKRPLL